MLKFVNVSGNSAEIADATTRSTNIASGTAFTLSSVASTAFSRPEDGAWNPLNPNEYYFVTTDRLDQASDGVGSQVGRSRLWRLTFADITNPDAGGTIDLLIDGDTVDGAKVNMLDNLTIDRNGRILLQEDTGGAAHNAKIWQYDIATDTATMLAEHDPARFGDIGVPATAPFTTDEESSGIIDAQDVLGPGWFLLTVMAHYPLGRRTGRGRPTSGALRHPSAGRLTPADWGICDTDRAWSRIVSGPSRRARGLEAEDSFRIGSGMGERPSARSCTARGQKNETAIPVNMVAGPSGRPSLSATVEAMSAVFWLRSASSGQIDCPNSTAWPGSTLVIPAELSAPRRGNREGLRDAGLDASLLALNSALAIALADPDIAERYLAGEPVFEAVRLD